MNIKKITKNIQHLYSKLLIYNNQKIIYNIYFFNIIF